MSQSTSVRTAEFGSRAEPRASTRALGSFALALACTLGCVAAASAQAPAPLPAGIDPIDIPPERDPLRHAWDRPEERGGFYLRGSLGLGFMAGRLGPPPWDSDDYDARVARGFGTAFGLDLGWALAPWVAVHLNTHAAVLWNGDLEREFAVQDSLDARVNAYGLGPAVTFFTPHDFFFTGAFGMGIARTRYRGYNKTTDPGFYMNLVAGKDLYVGRHFSVGVQFQVAYMLLGADQVPDELRVREFLFGMSMAYDSI
jgi:hypothetical protein